MLLLYSDDPELLPVFSVSVKSSKFWKTCWCGINRGWDSDIYMVAVCSIVPSHRKDQQTPMTLVTSDRPFKSLTLFIKL